MNKKMLNPLVERGWLEKRPDGSFRQVGDDCFEIVVYLAKVFGFVSPLSRRSLAETIRRIKANWLWGAPACSPTQAEAWIVVYETDEVLRGDVHVAFRLGDKEFNFGDGEKEGLVKVMTIPLKRK